MEICNAYEIAAANLALALERDVVSAEERQAVKEAVGESLDLTMDVLNMLIVSGNAKLCTGKLTAEKAKKLTKAEYKAMGLDAVLQYEQVEPAINLFFERAAFAATDAAAQTGSIAEIYNAGKSCPVERVRDALCIYCLRLLSHFGLVTYDMAFTREVLSDINGMDENRRAEAILPPAIISEL